MLTSLQKYKRSIIVAAVLLVGLFAYMVYANMQYRITRISPNNKSYPASLGVMDVYFNRTLDKDALNAVAKGEPGKIAEATFDGGVYVTALDDHLRLTFVRTPAKGDYEIKLKDIKTTSGDTLSKTIPLTIKDIPYEKMNKEEKALFNQAAADAGQGDDFKYPLLTKLPYQADTYIIDFRYAESDPAPTIVITMKFFAPGSNAVPATPEENAAYIADLRAGRNQALAWLRSQASDLESKYSLEYTEVELQEEFPKGRARYQYEKADPADLTDTPGL